MVSDAIHILVSLTRVFHADCLLTLSDLAPDLQNSISCLCERWWVMERRDRAEVVPNTVLYLLARALAGGSKVCSHACSWKYRSSFLCTLCLRICGNIFVMVLRDLQGVYPNLGCAIKTVFSQLNILIMNGALKNMSSGYELHQYKKKLHYINMKREDK